MPFFLSFGCAGFGFELGSVHLRCNGVRFTYAAQSASSLLVSGKRAYLRASREYPAYGIPFGVPFFFPLDVQALDLNSVPCTLGATESDSRISHFCVLARGKGKITIKVEGNDEISSIDVDNDSFEHSRAWCKDIHGVHPLWLFLEGDLTIKEFHFE